MTIHLNLEWKASLRDSRVFAFGDVRPVINGHANKMIKLSDVFYGLGALSMNGPERAGEGMVWRGRIGATPPLEQAEVIAGSIEQFSTPFFLGWLGEPVAQGYFSAGMSTLHQLYQRVFDEIPEQYPPDAARMVCLEIVGAAKSRDLHDRALKRPVHEGNTLITERPSEYFNFRLIQHDLEQRGDPQDQPLTLAAVGVGYRPGSESSALQRLEEAVFYEPPRAEDPSIVTSLTADEKRKTRTHTHIMVWRSELGMRDHLMTPPQQSEWKILAREFEKEFLPDLLARKPDYVVHLDEWSRITNGFLRVFMCSPESIQFLPI